MALDGFRYASAGPALLATGGKPAARESHLSEHLPFVAFHGDNIMVLREGDLMATLRLDGVSAMTTPDSDTYARAEVGRILALRVRLMAANQKREAAHAQHIAADRLAEREFMRMAVAR